ncbi:MAG TPA: hypothetical protein VK961_01705 [Chthoniobacter sp.]|nr:hypothetical protein [Chthoniobacter sp.]
MITLNFDLTTGVAKLAQTATIKQGAIVPVRVVFSTVPGSVDAIRLAFGDDSTAPQVLAYTEAFTVENDITWTALLDASDERLAAFMAGKGPTTVNVELSVTLDGTRQVAPNLSLTVQPPIVTGPTTSEGGPQYYTQPEITTLLESYVPRTVAGKYRLKSDGSLQLWNATESKWHSLTISGAAGAEVLSIGAGEN